MTSGPEMCAVCGTPRSGRLESNCPTCLMRLATPSPEEEDHAGQVSSGLEAGGSGRIGDYDLVGEIAHGGMGIVYRAVQISLKREVALKLMLAAEFANETARKRFHREAEAAAGLHHANIVSIYEIGEQAGRPYFSMELVEGRNLAELTRDKPLPARDAARIARTLSEAVQYAHEHGVLHRDLKPSNVLLDNLGEPHITDFGLAKQMEIGADLTMTGQVLGTPSYMPPEQAEAKRGPTTAASDVYSLGAILYQLLTARPPFMAETLTQTLRLVVEGDPVSPRLLNPSVPRDLETICLKCLEKEPCSRYSTARDLAHELGRFLNNEPIRARPVGPPARLARWCRRKPSLALALGGVIALLLVLAIGSPIAIFRISRARNTAEAAQHETQAQLYFALLEQARATVRSGELGHRVRTLDAIRRAAAITNTAELRREAMAALALPDLRFEREIPIDPGFSSLQPDPFLESLARCRGSGPVEIISLGDGHLMATLPAAVPRICYLIKWSPDNRFLALKREPATTEEMPWLEVWDVGNTNRVLLIENGDYQALAFHPRLPRLLGGKSDGGLTLWDVDERKELARFALPISIFDRALIKQAGGANLAQLAFSPNGERFVAAYFGQSNFLVSAHQAQSGEMLWSSVFTNNVTDLEWDPTGRWIGASEDQGWVQLVDARTGKYRTLGRQKLQAVSVAFSRDGTWLLSGGWEREVIAWDTRTAERAFSLALDSFRAQFSADGMRCGALTRKGCDIFTFEQPSACRQLNGLIRAKITQSTVSGDNQWLAVSDAERLAVWDLAGDAPPAVTSGGHSSSVFFSGGELFTSRDGGCARWRIELPVRAGEAPRLRKLDFPLGRSATSICLLSNDVVETSAQGSRVIDINAKAAANDSWFPTVSGVNGASPNGRWLGIFKPYDDVLNIYALPDFRPVAELTNQMAIRSFEFSPTGNELAVAGTTQVDVWNTRTWQRTQALTNFMDLHFSPNSPSAWWLTVDFRSAGLYDRRSGHLLLPLPLSTLPLAVSPDGRFLVVSVEGRSLQVWDLPELRGSLKNLGVDWTDK